MCLCALPLTFLYRTRPGLCPGGEGVSSISSPIPMSWKPPVPSSPSRPGHSHVHAHATESAVGTSSAVTVPSKDRLCSHKGDDCPPALPCHHSPPSRLRIACPPFHATTALPLICALPAHPSMPPWPSLSFARCLPTLPCHHGPPSHLHVACLPFCATMAL